jgi:CheY-like chemotaxis protein
MAGDIGGSGAGEHLPEVTGLSRHHGEFPAQTLLPRYELALNHLVIQDLSADRTIVQVHRRHTGAADQAVPEFTLHLALAAKRGLGVGELVRGHSFTPISTGGSIGVALSHQCLSFCSQSIRAMARVDFFHPFSRAPGMRVHSAAPPVVLVVEDEMLLRMRAVDMVEDAGYTSVEAVDADEAVKILESRSDIALLFTDIQMAGSH